MINKIRAFTLLELSIVIAVIGLLLGAVIAGENMIYTSKIKNTASEAQNYLTLMRVFRDKFGKYPGDYNNASATLGCTAGAMPVGCNGNGNGQILYTAVSVIGQGNEILRAWQHLYLAKMVDIPYTGVSANTNGQYVLGVNIPAAKVDPGGYGFETTTVNNQFYLMMRLGHQNTNQNTAVARSPEDAKAIDFKIDDGNPVTGLVQNNTLGYPTQCHTGTGSTATWLSSKVIACEVLFILQRF